MTFFFFFRSTFQRSFEVYTGCGVEKLANRSVSERKAFLPEGGDARRTFQYVSEESTRLCLSICVRMTGGKNCFGRLSVRLNSRQVWYMAGPDDA